MEILLDRFKESLLVDIMFDKKIGNNTVGNDLKTINEKYSLSFEEEIFQIMLIKIYFDEDPLSEKNLHLKIIGYDIRDKIISILKNNIIEVDTLISSNRSYYLLNFKENNRDKILSGIQEAMDYAVEKYKYRENFCEFRIFIGLSTETDEISFINLVDEAEMAMEQRLLEGNKKIIKFIDVPKCYDLNEGFLNDKEKDMFFSLIESKDKNAIVAFVKNLEVKISEEKSKYSNGTKILYACTNLIEIFAEEMIKKGFTKEIDYGLIQCFNKGKKGCCSVAEIIDMTAVLIENALELAGFGEIIFEE